MLLPRAGIYPAVDPLASSVLLLIHPLLVPEPTVLAMAVQGRPLQEYSDLQDIIAILGMDRLSEEQQRTTARAPRKIQQFLSQSFHVAEKFTGNPGGCTAPLRRLPARSQRLLTVVR